MHIYTIVLLSFPLLASCGDNAPPRLMPDPSGYATWRSEQVVDAGTPDSSPIESK